MLRAHLGPGRVPVRLRHPQPVEGPTRRSRSTSTASAVGYEPAEAVTKIKGGNSNWRGPIWFPTCFLLIESLRKLGKAYGPHVRRGDAGSPAASRSPSARWPGSLADRLIRIFTRDRNRPPPGLRRQRASSRTIRTGAI